MSDSIHPEPFLPLFVPITAEPPQKLPALPSFDPAEFEAFWRACPRRVGKGFARKAYLKARTLIDAETLLVGICRYAEGCRQRGTEEHFICHPSTWLNQERWLDEGGSDAQPARYTLNGRPPRGRADTVLAAGFAAGARARDRDANR